MRFTLSIGGVECYFKLENVSVDDRPNAETGRTSPLRISAIGHYNNASVVCALV